MRQKNREKDKAPRSPPGQADRVKAQSFRCALGRFRRKSSVLVDDADDGISEKDETDGCGNGEEKNQPNGVSERDTKRGNVSERRVARDKWQSDCAHRNAEKTKRQ